SAAAPTAAPTEPEPEAVILPEIPGLGTATEPSPAPETAASAPAVAPDRPATLPAAAASSATAPTPEPARRPHQRVYHLTDSSKLAVELDQRLEALGYELELLDD